uniref:Striatin-3 n=1 Tax=Melanaphis sacchari TaxID=742174 RepID=A0A2H8TTB6_9HEMI
MESKVCKVISAKRNHSDDDDDNINSKQTKRHSSRDRQSTKDKYDKGGRRNYEELKVGDPYYSGGTATYYRKGEDRYEDDSRYRRRHRSRDRQEKENRSKNADSKKEEKIGAPYYSGGIASIDERESGEEITDDEDDKIGQRYYSTETADTQRKNSENYWNKYAKKDKKQNDDINDVPLHQKKTVELLTSKTGGAYIPPAKLRMMQESITDKSSAAYQRIAWEALKKSIHGLTNKINVDNIGKVTRDLLRENIVRGRGLLCRSIMQAQLASTTYTHVYAALVAIINTKFPNIGELLLTRCIVQFKRGYRRNEKSQCLGSVTFIAHLINQSVAHEILALELLTLFVETPTEDSIEVAVAFLKECGQKMSQVSKKGMNAIFDMLRNILHDGQLDKRVQYMIEVMFQIRKDGFKDHPAVIEQLDLVPEEDQFTHLLTLDSAKDPQDILNVYKFDPDFEANEERYKSLRAEILGSDNEDESGSENDGDDDDDDDEDDDEMGMADDVIDMTSICKFGPDDVDAEADEVVNELQLLTEDISNKENEQNDWKVSNRDVFNKNSNNANWIKNEPVEMVDGNIDLALGLGELAQLTVNNESETNADIIDMKTASRKTWNAKYTLRSHFDGVRALAFHPTESILITASEDHTMKLWNLQKTIAPKKSASLDVEPLYTFRSHTGPVFCLAISKNGEHVYSGGLDNVIKVWSMPSANIDPYDSYDKNILINNLEGHEDAVWGISVHHNRSELLSCSADGSVKLWSPTNLKTPCLSSYVSDQDEIPTSVDYVRDVEGQFVASYNSSHCVIYDIETKSPVTRLECSKDPTEMATQLIHRVKCHPTLPLTITAHDDHHIRFFDNNTGKMVHSMVAHLDAVTSLAVDPNGLYLLSGSHDSSIRIWNLESKTCVQEITAHRKKLDESILDVAFHPSEAYIASAGADSLVKVFV